MSTTVPPRREKEAPAEVLTPPADTGTLTGAVPRLAEGVELIGRFEDSGFKEPPFIARRADGQVVQMPKLLFQLAEEVDGVRGHDEIAERLSHRIERGVSLEVVEMLLEEQLRPLGVVAPAEGDAPQQLKKVDPLLALKFKTKVVPERAVRAITWIFQPLFWPPVLVLAVAAMLALDAWLFAVHGVSQSLRHAIYDPALLLMAVGCVAVATAFHEIGHATACRYGGAKPGVMGVGIYIVWPAFYTDITDAYRLGKWGRLRTDLGGMYFNAIFALAAGAAFFATGFEPLLLLVVLQNFAIVQQALPFLRLDGYYIVSDLTGVPDILVRIRAILRSLIPWHKPDDRVTELKPWVRVVVTAYVALLVPVVAFIFAMMLINAPRIFATAWDSFWLHFDVVGPAFGHGQVLRGLRALFEMIVLALPAIGAAYTAGRVSHRFGTGAWRWSSGSAPRRSAVALIGAAFIGLIAYVWWPNGDYRPIQPGEKGTIQAGFSSIGGVPSGRPSLSDERSKQLGGAPSERAVRSGKAKRPSSVDGTQGSSGDGSGSGGQDSSGQSQDGGSGSSGSEPSTSSGSSGSTGTQPAPSGTSTSTTTTPSSTQPAPSGTSTAPSTTGSTTTSTTPTTTDSTTTSTTPTTTDPTTTSTTPDSGTTTAPKTETSTTPTP